MHSLECESVVFTPKARVVQNCCVQWTTIGYVILSKLWKSNTIRMHPLAVACQPHSAMRKNSEICRFVQFPSLQYNTRYASYTICRDLEFVSHFNR